MFHSEPNESWQLPFLRQRGEGSLFNWADVSCHLHAAGRVGTGRSRCGVVNSHTCFYTSRVTFHSAAGISAPGYDALLGKTLLGRGFVTPLLRASDTRLAGDRHEQGGGERGGRHSPSADTQSSPSSCFGTWRLQSYSFPASSFSSHLLPGLPTKSERYLLTGRQER